MINIEIFKKLHSFNLNVRFEFRDEVLVIQGESGSGKTTILDCIAGIKKPDNGEIDINNKLLFSSKQSKNLPIKDRNISYVFQYYALFPHMTIKKNISFGLDCRQYPEDDNLEYIMETFKIKRLEHKYPNQISGGEKQRVAFARALVVKPEILLLDEPFSALDLDTRQPLYEEFRQLKKSNSISIILVTHDRNEAKLLGDEIIEIKNGIILK